METLQHRLAAVWFADIVGFTSQAATDEGQALRVVQSFQESARDVVRRHGGRIVKFIGDAVMAEFGSTEAAVRAAAALPDACTGHATSAGVTCPTLRIAVHMGDVTTTADGDVYGDGVNTAARIVKVVKPGEVWVSEDVWRQLRSRPRIRFEERGTQELKDVGATRVWAVTKVEGEAAPAASPARALLAKVRRRHVVAGLALLAAVAAWVAFGPRRGERTLSGALDPARIAVLYFQDLTPDSTSGHLAAGFTEAIIDQLSGVEGLDVVSRHGVDRFRGGAAPIDSVALALHAGTIVDGSVERRDDRVTVRIRMVDPAANRQIDTWTEERPWTEILPLQDAIAEDIVARLRQRLGEQLRMATRRSGTTNVEAWELVERAERLAEQARASGQDDPAVAQSLREDADQFLARAEEVDRRWVEPTIERAQVAAWMGDEESYQRGVALATSALERDPGNARALAVRGALYDSLASVARDSVTAAGWLARAQRDLRSAVAAEPGLASAWIALASLLYNDLWNLSAARQAARSAYDADVFLLEADHFSWLCEISMQLKDFEEAMRWCEEGRRSFPRRAARILMVELTILASEGSEPNPARAWGLVEEMGRLAEAESNTPPAQMVVAAVLVRAGRADSAQAVVRRAKAAAPEGYEPYMAYLESYVQLLAGNRRASLGLLRTFLSVSADYRYQIANDHWYDRLDGDPDFEALVDRRHLPIFCRILCKPPP